MSLPLILKLLHVFAAIWLITGLIGRNLVLSMAGRSTSVQQLQAMLPIGTIFEKRMVIPGSTAVLLAGLITAWAQGWPILGFLQGGASNWVLVSLFLFLTIFPLIRFVFLPRAKIFEAALKESAARDAITPELTAALHDPAVRAGHLYEIVLLVVIVSLMVLKPF